MRGKQIAERLWAWLNAPVLLVFPLLLVGCAFLLSLWLPQSPVPLRDAAAFSRWLASVRPQLEPHADWLAAWGLLALQTTLWMRLPLALLALILAARGVALRERWPALSPLARARQLLIALGLAGLLVGWGVQLRWGWVETGILAWPGEPVSLPRSGAALPPSKEGARLRLYRGVLLFDEALTLGLDVQARNHEGEIVPVQLAARSAAQSEARFILSAQLPDGYFGIPEADLVFRITLQQPPPEPQIQVQIYRSSSGALLTETLLRGSGLIFADKFQFQLNGVFVPQLRAVYDPGAPFTLAAWALLAAAGVLAGLEWRGRRVAAAAAQRLENAV